MGIKPVTKSCQNNPHVIPHRYLNTSKSISVNMTSDGHHFKTCIALMALFDQIRAYFLFLALYRTMVADNSVITSTETNDIDGLVAICIVSV